MIEPSTFVPEDFKEESPTIPPTEMIYYDYEGNFQMKCNAKIVSVHFYDDNKIQLCLDKTVMHAQGGGQPADRGSISLLEDDAQVDVTKVTMDRSTNIATHIGTVKDSFASKIIVGIPVCVKVDEGNRRVLAECHTAGHVVDAAMVRTGTLLPPIKGFHFLDGPYVEYRGSVPAEDRTALLEQLKATFQELVTEDLETKIEFLPKDQADEVCNRVAENFFNMNDYIDDTVRVVTVAGRPSPCGGTHIKSTGLLGKRNWGIIGLKCKKGVVRVKYGQI